MGELGSCREDPISSQEGKVNVEMDYTGEVGHRKLHKPCSLICFLCEVGAGPVSCREGVGWDPGAPGVVAEW